MKKPTNNLATLIRSMTPAEKRYFTRRYKLSGNKLFDLYEAINKCDPYDEVFIKEQFSGTNLAKNLKVHKSQLLDLLLKSQVAYHAKSSVRSKIYQGLEEVEVLKNAGLYDMGVTKAEKLVKLCTEHGLLSLKVVCTQMVEAVLALRMDSEVHNEEESLMAVANKDKRLQQMFKDIEYMSRIKLLERRAYDLLYEGSETIMKEAFSNLIKHPLITSMPELSDPVKPYYQQVLYSINAAASRGLNKHQEAHELSSRFLAKIKIEYQRNPHDYAYEMVRAIVNHLNDAYLIKNFQSVDDWVPEAEKICKKYRKLNMSLLFVYLHQLNIYHAACRWDSIAVYEPKIARFLKQNNAISHPVGQYIQLNLAFYSLITNNLEQARKYLDNINHNNELLEQEYPYLIPILMDMIDYSAGQFKPTPIKNIKETPSYFQVWRENLELVMSSPDHARLWNQCYNNWQNQAEPPVFRHFKVESWILANAKGSPLRKILQQAFRKAV